MRNLRLNKVLLGIALIVGFSNFNQSFANQSCYVSDSDIRGTYTGDCVNGKAHGQGESKGKDHYKGEFKDGKTNGKGIYTWANGTKYEGERQNDMRHGKGVLTWTNGSKYDGEWQNGKRNGLGKLTLSKGDSINWQIDNKGEWQGNTYVVQGRFQNDSLIQKMNNEQYANALKEQAEKLRKESEIQAEKARKEAEAKAKAEQEKQLAEQKEKELIASLKACGSRVYDEKAGITAEDFGTCDKVNTDEFLGIVLYKQNGKYFDLQCHNGEKSDYDSTAKRLINNFETDRCWKALHLIPNSCEVNNYRGQCDTNKKPNGVGYQYYAYGKDWLTNYQMYRGMFRDGKRNGHGSYYELAGCGLLGCTSGWSRTGSAWFKNGEKEYDCTFNFQECETKPAREAEQARKEKEAYDKKVANFRKNLKVGDDATAGMVIEIKGDLIKIQTNDRQCSQKDYNGKCMNYVNTPVEKWVKRRDLYPAD